MPARSAGVLLEAVAMTVVWTNETYILAMWFVEADGFNWQATIYHDGDKKWKLSYRFRYYEDNKIFNSKDRRNQYDADILGEMTEGDLISKVDQMARLLADKHHVRFERLIIRGGPKKLAAKSKKTKWLHVREEILPPTSGSIH
jgi:hypothetical protein